MSVSFIITGSCAAFTLKSVNKVALQGFRNTTLKSKTILESVIYLKNNLKFTKFQTFTNATVQSLLGETGKIP